MNSLLATSTENAHPLIEPLLHAELGHRVALGPWQACVIGPADDAVDASVASVLSPWLATIPHGRDMPCNLVAFPGTSTDRSFPAPLGMLWPSELGWRPLLNPWNDPGAGVALVEVLGDVAEIRDLLPQLAERLYAGLVLDPAPVGGLLDEACRLAGAAFEWSEGAVRALAQDSRALSPGADMATIHFQEEPSEIGEGEEVSEWAGRARIFLSFLIGSGPLPDLLLPQLEGRWVEAVTAPRDLSSEEIAAFPRTIHTAHYAPLLAACARLGAIRRRLAIERAAELIHGEGWGIQLAEEPSVDQAEVGQHRLPGDLLLLRHGWQIAQREGEGCCLGGIGGDSFRWRWNDELLAEVGSPFLGLPFHAPRRLDPRDALRTLEDWALVEELRQRKIVLRAASKGLLRSRNAAAFGDPEPHLRWAQDVGLIRDLRKLVSWAYVLG